MFGRDSDADDDESFFTNKYHHSHDNDSKRGSWLEAMGVSGFLYLAAAIVLIVIIIGCCCSRKRNRGQVLSNAASVPPAPPAPNNAAHYPQQQYSPYPVQPPAPVTSYPVQSAPYPTVTPYPHPAPAPYPHGAPYPPATPYPPAVPYPTAAPYPAAPSAPDHGVLPPSYEQAVGNKDPPYNPHHH